MENQLREFFSKQGSIGLILAVGPDGARFKDIKPQVAVSHDTVAIRIDEARNIGLINTEPTSDVGTTFRNTLTESGRVCYSGMVELGIHEAHAEYIEAINRYNQLSNSYAGKVADKREWYDWFKKSDILKTMHGRFKNNEEIFSQFPEPLQEALQQDSVEPLLKSESEYIDVLLWEFMCYPPEPEVEDVEGLGEFFETNYRIR